MRFIARAPVVVFNAPFNQGTLERAFEHNLGSQPTLEWLDLMVLLPSLYPERIGGQARMDAWLGAFGIDRLDHRDALLEALRASPSCTRLPWPAPAMPRASPARGSCSTPRAAASGCGAVEGVNDKGRSRALFNPPG
jgi:hypothetical protein